MPRIAPPSTEAPVIAHAEDRALAERLVRGDVAAWQSFVHTHGRIIRARVADVAESFGRLQDEAAIDDATAEVFAMLLNNDAAALRAYAGRSSLATYVAVIATRSTARKFARKQLVVEADVQTEVARMAWDQSRAEPNRELMRSEQRQLVHDMLQLLPDKQRDVVQLFHLQGQSYAQISQQLAIPIGSVGPTLRRAEAKLRQWIEDDEKD